MGAGRVRLVEILVLALALFGALEMLDLLRWARPAAEQQPRLPGAESDQV